QLRDKRRELRRVLARFRRDRGEIPRELAADLREHLQVAFGNFGAGALERVEWCVDFRDRAAERGVLLEQPLAQEQSRDRRDDPRPAAENLIELVEQVLA